MSPPRVTINRGILSDCPHILKTWMFPDSGTYPFDYSNPHCKPESYYLSCVRTGPHSVHHGSLAGEELTWS